MYTCKEKYIHKEIILPKNIVSCDLQVVGFGDFYFFLLSVLFKIMN